MPDVTPAIPSGTPPTPYYSDATTTVYAGDCLDVLAPLPDASVDAVVTDPPYALGFMGREWDTFGMDVGRGAQARRQRSTEVTPEGKGHSTSAGPYLASGVDSLRAAGLPFQRWCEAWSRECLRVLKPGGHLLAFGGTRTWHRLACAVEDAGFEVRDSVAWLYGSGFPKSLDVSKAIDKAAGAERATRNGSGDHVGTVDFGMKNRCPDCGKPYFSANPCECPRLDRVAVTDAAREWQGWGTALKPAFEPIVVARKPLVGTVAANVLAHGTGALNVDGCRVEAGQDYADKCASVVGLSSGHGYSDLGGMPRVDSTNPAGRWPANVILDPSQAAALDEQSGDSLSRIGKPRGADSGDGWGMTATGAEYDDAGGASRFFYTAKADASERVRVDGIAHPTVKPLALMRWLVRLVTPPGGTVLEPFAGSGTTVEACILEGFQCLAIEREADYLPLIVQRINRRRDPVQAVKGAGGDGGLFDLLDGGAA